MNVQLSTQPCGNLEELPISCDNNGVESAFIREYLVTKSKQAVPISSVCNARCVFCSNNSNPFPLPKPDFRDIEDIKLNVQALPENIPQIRVSENLPGRIREGEALLHPKLFEILALMRRKCPRAILVIATNGIALCEELVLELVKSKPLRIETLSINSSDPEHWQALTGGSKDQAERAIEAPAILAKFGIPFRASIVPVPRLTGWEDIEHTIADCGRYGTRGMTIWHPGYSKYVDKEVSDLLECDWFQLQSFLNNVMKRHRVQVRLAPGKLSHRDKEMVHNIVMKTPSRKRALWLASEAAYREIQETVALCPYGNPRNHRVISVKNNTYGGNIIVAGLLCVNDFIAAARKYLDEFEADEVLVPSAPFDTLARDLLYEPFYKIEEALGVPTRMV